MSRESSDGHVCPKCETTIYREECACTGPDTDVLGNDLLQSWLEVAYARYIHASTRNLVGHLYGLSPLVERHKLNVSWDEL